MSVVLVQLQNSTAPISAGLPPDLGQRLPRRQQSHVVQTQFGVAALLDAGFLRRSHLRSCVTSSRRDCG